MGLYLCSDWLDFLAVFSPEKIITMLRCLYSDVEKVVNSRVGGVWGGVVSLKTTFEPFGTR